MQHDLQRGEGEQASREETIRARWRQAQLAHEFQVHSFASFTWCAACGTFLVGIREQGFRCNRCEEARCEKCAKRRDVCPYKATAKSEQEIAESAALEKEVAEKNAADVRVAQVDRGFRLSSTSVAAGSNLEEPLLGAGSLRLFAVEMRDAMMDWLLVATFIEYGFGAVCFVCGIHGFLKLAQAIQVFFAAAAVAVEYSIYKKMGKPLDGQVLDSICCINVSRLGIPLRIWYLIVYAPNYVHVQASAVLAGTMFSPWYSSAFEESREQFLTNWRKLPIVGNHISELGIPVLVTIILGCSCCYHSGSVLMARVMTRTFISRRRSRRESYNSCWLLAEVCDLANLRFLSACFRANCEDNFKDLIYGRLWSVLCVKVPLLWLKISWVSVAFCYIGTHKEIITTSWALATGWNTILQFIPDFVRSVNAARDPPETIIATSLESMGRIGLQRMQAYADPRSSLILSAVVPLVLLLLAIMTLILHMGGVWLCPSRDFSILRLGCSPPHNNTALTCR